MAPSFLWLRPNCEVILDPSLSFMPPLIHWFNYLNLSISPLFDHFCLMLGILTPTLAYPEHPVRQWPGDVFFSQLRSAHAILWLKVSSGDLFTQCSYSSLQDPMFYLRHPTSCPRSVPCSSQLAFSARSAPSPPARGALTWGQDPCTAFPMDTCSLPSLLGNPSSIALSETPLTILFQTVPSHHSLGVAPGLL
jgi:hypothetical protein